MTLLEKPIDSKSTNPALEIADAMAPFLTPVPSDDSEFIKTVAQFALELSPRQNSVLSKLKMLTYEKVLNPIEKEKIEYFINSYFENKRYHDAKFFISDAIQSMSWRKFVLTGAVSGSVNKSTQM